MKRKNKFKGKKRDKGKNKGQSPKNKNKSVDSYMIEFDSMVRLNLLLISMKSNSIDINRKPNESINILLFLKNDLNIDIIFYFMKKIIR